MPASPALIAVPLITTALFASARNQQMQEKKGATTTAAAASADYQRLKQEARNKNQAPNPADLDKARQNAIFNLRRGSGRQSTFLSNGLGG